MPGVELKKRGHHVVLNDFLTIDRVREFDIIVFQRQFIASSLRAIDYANSLGKLTVYELDDDLWHIDKASPAYNFWSDPRKLRAVEAALKACQLVTTSTPYLAELLRQYNKNVVVLPNMLPSEYWQVKHESREDGKIIIGWAGGAHHWSDLEILRGTIEQILDDYPHVELHVVGMREYPFKEHERIKILKPVRLEEYSKLLSKFDIGIAPLVDTQFNHCKSDLKFIEYGMVGLPVVASKVIPYMKSVVHGENGFLAQNPKDWMKFLRRLIEDPDLRLKLGRKAKEYAQTRTIEKNIWMWERAYNIT
ncbi:MAG: glycosyltransferase family 4 protein [Actinomycetota bacterium]|nr:glycosyltransferase family 4 protein [Actinomycetota bacterium]